MWLFAVGWVDVDHNIIIHTELNQVTISWPNIATATTTDISSLAVIGRLQRSLGHLNWNKRKSQ